MKKILTILFCALFCVSPISCNAQNKEQIKEKLLQAVEQYSENEKRIYYLNKNKGGCRIVYMLNDLLCSIDYSNTASAGTMPINEGLFKSGRQKLQVKLYPTEGKQTLTDITRIELVIDYIYKKDMYKRGGPESVVLQHYILPKEIIKQELPYYEFEIEFDAEVPYDYSRIIENAKDLRKIDGIENKIISAYKNIREMLEEGDVEAYWRIAFEKEVRHANSMYSTKESVSRNIDQVIKIFNIKNKKMYLFENYEFIYQNEGRVVRLVRRKDKEPLTGFDFVDEDGVEGSGSLIIDLYMPKDSDELKVF